MLVALRSVLKALALSCVLSFPGGGGAQPQPLEPPARSACPVPAGDLPTLTFTLPLYRKGELDRRCGPEIERAARAGFTGVTLVPSIEFEPAPAHRIVPGSTYAPGEIERCLDLAFHAGMDIVYMPHLEAAETLRSDGDQVWRGRFMLVPGETYMAEAFGEFFRWARRHARHIRSSETRLFLVVAAELEQSTTTFPEWWRVFVSELRRDLAEAALSDRVRIGFNPNWKPRRDPSPLSCGHFRAFVGELDFVAPSLYGDWSEAWRGMDQAEKVKRDVLDLLAGRLLCDVTEFRERPFAIGEFGLGGDLGFAAGNWAPAREGLAEFVRTRAEVFRNLFEWIERRGAGPNGLAFVNLWTLGVFDPIFEGTAELGPDTRIRRLLRDYTAKRCPGYFERIADVDGGTLRASGSPSVPIAAAGESEGNGVRR